MTFGLTSPFYQYYDFPEAICSEDKIYLAPRVEQSKNKKQFTKKQIERNSFIIRYKNFIQSPRSHYIYRGVYNLNDLFI